MEKGNNFIFLLTCWSKDITISTKHLFKFVWIILGFQWFDNDAPESIDYPCGYTGKLRPFGSLMLLRCFRVDRVFRAISNYITVTMGEEFITPPVVRSATTDLLASISPLVFISPQVFLKLKILRTLP